MKRNNKKGFTIVELVIVIAVIAILAAVLIPTFAGVTKKANESKALQEAKNSYSEDLALLDGQAGNYMKSGYVEFKKTTDVALDSTKTYYTKSGDNYVKVASPDVADIANYYEEDLTDSITKGEFDGEKYTYKLNPKYICTYDNGTWDIAEVK